MGLLNRWLPEYFQKKVFARNYGTPLQYSCLENSMDKGAWWTSVRGVTKSRTQLSTAAQLLGSAKQSVPSTPAPNTHHLPQQHFNFVHVNHQLFLFSNQPHPNLTIAPFWDSHSGDARLQRSLPGPVVILRTGADDPQGPN